MQKNFAVYLIVGIAVNMCTLKLTLWATNKINRKLEPLGSTTKVIKHIVLNTAVGGMTFVCNKFLTQNTGIALKLSVMIVVAYNVVIRTHAAAAEAQKKKETEEAQKKKEAEERASDAFATALAQEEALKKKKQKLAEQPQPVGEQPAPQDQDQPGESPAPQGQAQPGERPEEPKAQPGEGPAPQAQVQPEPQAQAPSGESLAKLAAEKDAERVEEQQEQGFRQAHDNLAQATTHIQQLAAQKPADPQKLEEAQQELGSAWWNYLQWLPFVPRKPVVSKELPIVVPQTPLSSRLLTDSSQEPKKPAQQAAEPAPQAAEPAPKPAPQAVEKPA